MISLTRMQICKRNLMIIQQAATTNIHCLTTLAEHIRGLEKTLYTREIPLIPSSTGIHVRHILEHYQALQHGLDKQQVCYDDRKRARFLEQSPQKACSMIKEIIHWLGTLDKDCELSVLTKVMETDTPQPVTCISSLSRELLFVHDHTVHHQAMIATLLHAIAVPVDKNFGLAPATRLYALQQD